ncbi:MAG: GntR family transcriptional regulator [Bacteroidota bacterium]
MQIKESTGGIYVQIAEFGIEQVLSGAWANGEKIPSVRQLAAEAGVNPNTIMHAYDHLKDMNIIETQRGRGFFVCPDGQHRAVALRRSQFIETELPKLRRNLELLGIDLEELSSLLFPDSQNLN